MMTNQKSHIYCLIEGMQTFFTVCYLELQVGDDFYTFVLF